jgi:hypothetical protein
MPPSAPTIVTVPEVEVRVVEVDAARELQAGVGEALADLAAERQVQRPRAGRLVGVPPVAGAFSGRDLDEEVERERHRLSRDREIAGAVGDLDRGGVGDVRVGHGHDVVAASLREDA